MKTFPEDWQKLNVVLCHDWLTGMRGGERVLELLCEGFPNAPLFTLFHNPRAISETINRHRIRTSWLQAIPGMTRHYRCGLPLFPSAIELMDTPPADLLISSSHCVAKGLIPKPGTRHLCYCFTPMRYAWLFYGEYFGHSAVRSALARLLLPALRRWDLASSKRVDRFVAISRHVQDRIRRFYNRDADVVYPPVDIDRCTPAERPEPGRFDLIVSALVPYKKIEVAVDAYTRMNRPLTIVGQGSELARLRQRAGATIDFLGWLPDADIIELYRTCRLLVFPGEEDFGIVPLEAQACGRPVVAFGQGGLLETVQDGVSGVFFPSQTAESLADAVERAGSMTWDPAAIRRNAERFGPQAFLDGMARSINACLER